MKNVKPQMNADKHRLINYPSDLVRTTTLKNLVLLAGNLCKMPHKFFPVNGLHDQGADRNMSVLFFHEGHEGTRRRRDFSLLRVPSCPSWI